MSRRRIPGTSVVSLLIITISGLHSTRAQSAAEPILQRRYKAAQSFQAAQELDKAAAEYRIFIADVLGELAIANAHAGNSSEAYAEFDEALHLVPSFPTLRLEYARVCFENGDTEHARTLIQEFLSAQSNDPKLSAKARALLGRVLLAMGKSAEAKQELEQAVKLDPTFDNGYNLGVAELNLGDGPAATTLFREMLASYGDTASIHLLFGQAYGGSDLQKEAVAEFQRAIAIDSKLPGAHYALASSYLASAGDTRLPEVKSELRKEISISPSSAAAYAALGHLLAAEGESAADNAEGLRLLKRATELEPSNPDAYLYLGQYYFNAKLDQEAEIALRRCILQTKDPSRNGYQVQRAHYLLGRILLKHGYSEEGKQEIAASQALRDTNLKHDQDRLADYMQTTPSTSSAASDTTLNAPSTEKEVADQQRHRKAFAHQFGPAIADSYNNLGAIAGSENNFRLALRYFEHAAQWNPALPGLDYNWGRAAFTAGATQESIAPLTRYIRAHPEDEAAKSVLGMAQFLSNDYTSTLATLGGLADKPGQSAQVQFAYADSLLKTQRVTDGVARLQKLEVVTPDVPDIHRALGEAYLIQHNPAAKDELKTAIRLAPLDAKTRVALGRLQVSEGDLHGAVATFESAVKLEPSNESLRQELSETKGKLSSSRK